MQVPLKVSLFYESHHQVTDQEILKDMTDSPQSIGTDGVARLKVHEALHRHAS
jgi:hypothetical protein